MKNSDTLICIPCFNSASTIASVVEPLLSSSDADLLIVDDLSDTPLSPLVEQRFAKYMQRVRVIRPDRKVYSGGARNIGIQNAIAAGYRIAVIVDSDVVTSHRFVECVRTYFRIHAKQVIVAPAILPAGNRWQYADTLINFSSYLPDKRRLTSRKHCLAGYAFALNIEVFRSRPCLHESRYGGEDVAFFRQLKTQFGLKTFTLMNYVPVVHMPNRRRLVQALWAQQRYGRAFLAHGDSRREYVFNRIPYLHYLTPRFCLMLGRLLRCRRFSDFLYAPLCWLLDIARARQIVRLCGRGNREPMHRMQTKSTEPTLS